MSETIEQAWYIARDGTQHGPLSEAELLALIERDVLRTTDLVWREGFPSWQAMGDLPAFQARGTSPAASEPQRMLLEPEPEIRRPAAAAHAHPSNDLRTNVPPPRRASVVPVVAGSVFLSYRRDDSAPWAGRIYERLAQDVAKSRIFMDVDNIAPGHDFLTVLDEKVAAAQILLCVIGPKWSDAKNARGQRRLDDPSDVVRIEVESALRHGKLVVPVLVDGAEMPPPESLPPAMQALSRRNGVTLTHGSFGRDMSALIEALPLSAATTTAEATQELTETTLAGMLSQIFAPVLAASVILLGIIIDRVSAGGPDRIWNMLLAVLVILLVVMTAMRARWRRSENLEVLSYWLAGAQALTIALVLGGELLGIRLDVQVPSAITRPVTSQSVAVPGLALVGLGVSALIGCVLAISRRITLRQRVS